MEDNKTESQPITSNFEQGNQITCKPQNHALSGLPNPGLAGDRQYRSVGGGSINTAVQAIGSTQVLIMKWIDQGIRTDAFRKRFGEQLALLHQATRPAGNWPDFFRDCRLRPRFGRNASRRCSQATSFVIPPASRCSFISLFSESRTSSGLLRHTRSFVKASFLASPRSYPSFLGHVRTLRCARVWEIYYTPFNVFDCR